MGAPTKAAECPHCHHSNPTGTSRCASCGTWIGSDNATMTHAAVDTNWAATRAGSIGSNAVLSLEAGSVLADRYEILSLLGEGGMGAVYKAKDRELDRLVALKVIRSELTGNSIILHRFKQELILARKITHRNIIRIYDLGVADGVRFITMEFVDGQDLSSLLEERKYTPEEAVKILRQVCAALEAAHAEGVVHRDLKPQNVMIESSGRVVVMDFGLARSVEATGMTQVGAVMGTPAYMSPEQAKGLAADERSDIFSVGIIAYKMLTGDVPYKADTMLASLSLRTLGPPPPPIQIDPTLPPALSDIILKSLATDPVDRYQSAALVAKDLQDWEEGKLHQAIVTPPMAMMAESKAGKWIALAVGAAVLVMAGVYGVNRMSKKPAAVAPMTVIIADFNNHTGDPVFNGTLESTLKLALEGASFISAYDRTKLKDLGVQAISGTLDQSKAQEIAAKQGLNLVVSGALDRRGADYLLSLRAVQTVTGKVITSADATASSKDQVLFAVSKLGTALRRALGDSTSESAQRLSMETLTAASLEAVHEYAAGLDLVSQGKNQEALKHFAQAVDLDPNFGEAYTVMAAASRNLGRRQDAEKDIKEAIKHIDRMTERERFRTRATLYILIGDKQKCVDEWSALLERYPSDTGAHNNLAFCLTDLRNLSKAVEEERRAVAVLPKRAMYRSSLAFYSAFGGDFKTAAKEADESLKLGYDLGFLAQAWASLGQEQLAQATEAYRKLEKTNPSEASIGLADLAAYEGRFQAAVSILENGAAADMAASKPQPDAAADKFSALAYVQLLRGQKGPALEAAKRSLDLSQAVKTRFVAARVYVDLGEAAKAKELAAGLSSELPLEPQAYARLIEGEVALKNGNGRDAAQRFTEANRLLDTWIGRFDLGRAYLEIGAFTEADSEFDRCLKRRGEALALFLDEAPTYGYFPPVYYYQARVREGMKSSGFTESYKKYVSIRGKAGEDPLLADARRRIGQ